MWIEVDRVQLNTTLLAIHHLGYMLSVIALDIFCIYTNSYRWIISSKSIQSLECEMFARVLV
jgi:hypothetical protein